MYHKFDIVLLDKIHYNVFFDSIKDTSAFSDRIAKSKNLYWLMKQRPAMILRTFKHKSGDKNKIKYLVIPFTSKNSINSYYGAYATLRINFKDRRLQDGHSFLMLDAMLTISDDQINGFYMNKEMPIRISQSQKRFILRELTYKFNNLLEIPTYLK